MAKIDLVIPSLGNEFIDLRETIPGDSYNWSWVRPLSQVNYLAIHHTAAPDTQTPDEIANFHIQSNGWGGIGYHFLISKQAVVYYVGDISTARANVANLNEQVIGICLIGNFTDSEPTQKQIDSIRKLCQYLIDQPRLSNLKSFDSLKGHKELPGQATPCPGDTWPIWKAKITGSAPSGGSQPVGGLNPSQDSNRGAKIAELHRKVLGRDPDMGGLQTYINSPLTLEEIMKSLVQSQEHQNIIELAKQADSLVAEVENLQASLGLVNDRLINLQQTVVEKDMDTYSSNGELKNHPKTDQTLTIIQALVNLYKLVFLPGKVF